ncbi:OsmC family protein [Rheinheimera muenzenbergensis]|uniref:OsmC family protein n=1 Tax=Rheinheimera muenzenbergensis TaxID=1193628 RepID=A0ABU8C593_9GAMM|nr:OsmC family protein [Gammaproteobacteria bacterium]MBU1555067.1 OsmC family protein [Gammaproteobacteria bacterium]MBU2070385.1 OsmC family protein [Gammaproteobacteria bacterium]MBU2184753.1 OsmC family protein [Gammaproteobacteria bacterium]MBU2203668.1 OsmC family protein [Gammaproteobacteria bacterium]
MQAKVSWHNDNTFIGTSGSGHSVVFDGNKDNSSAPSPMEMVLMAAGACSSVDVVSILKKARQQVLDCEVQLSGERADSVPKVFTSIHLHFVVTGIDLSDKQVERAVKLSADKYCSVSIMLSGSVKVSHSFSVKAAQLSTTA